MNKLKFLTLTFILTASLVTGCTYETTYMQEDTKTDTIQLPADPLEKPQLTQELDVKGEDFKLVCTYDTGNYNTSDWHVTESKPINMTIHTKGLPKGYKVFLEHVHADVSLKSTSPSLNGIKQDTMDDSYHGTSQDGFYIDDTSNYSNIFLVDGYSEQFFSLWGYAVGGVDTISGMKYRLSEDNIIDKGTYAEKLQVVYDLAILSPTKNKFIHTSVLSEVLFPVSQDLSSYQRTETRDLISDEVITPRDLN